VIDRMEVRVIDGLTETSGRLAVQCQATTADATVPPPPRWKESGSTGLLS